MVTVNLLKGKKRTSMPWKLFIIASISIVATLIISEGAVRALGAAPRLIGFNLSSKQSVFKRSENSILGYEMRPGHRSSERKNCHENFPYVNAHGFRDIERDLTPRPNVKRIVVLGDSVAAGHGVCSLDDTIPRILDKRLSKNGFEVLNLGVGGYCTRAEIEVLRTKGLAFSPSLVIVLFVGNDYVDSNAEIIKTLSYERPKLATKLVRASHLARLGALRFDWWSFKTEAESADPFAAHVSSIGEGNVEEGFDILSKLSKEAKFRVAIALWPGFGDRTINPPAPTVRSADGSDLLVTYLAKERGFEVIDLAPFFKADHAKHTKPGAKRPASPRWLYTVGDGTHPSLRGAKVAARALSAKIREGYSGRLP